LTRPRTRADKREDDRIYSSARWRRLRKQKLAASPLCEAHQEMGDVVVATVVDHRIPIRHGGKPFPSLSGLRSLCWPCHSAKTARGPEAGAARTTKPRRGCDASGAPLDPRHPWAEDRGGGPKIEEDGARYARGDLGTQLVSGKGRADG
jgi:5-methylcytosine-specific restriction protein A